MRLCFSHSLIPQRFDLLITQYILYCYNILFTIRTSPMCEWGRMAIMSPHGALRAYTVLLTVEPLRGFPMTHLLQYRHGLHISDVRVGRGYHVTAWRTSCLYGVTYSRASPRLPDDVPFSVPVQFAHLRCASGEGAIMSPHGALRAYTVLLTAEPLRGSPMSHLLQYRYSLHISDVRVGRGAIMSPHGALRAYTVLLTVEPLRGFPMSYLLQYRTLFDWSDLSDRSDSSFKPITFPYCHSLLRFQH